MAKVTLNISEKELREHFKNFLLKKYVEEMPRGEIMKDEKFVEYLVKTTTKVDPRVQSIEISVS